MKYAFPQQINIQFIPECFGLFSWWYVVSFYNILLYVSNTGDSWLEISTIKYHAIPIFQIPMESPIYDALYFAKQSQISQLCYRLKSTIAKFDKCEQHWFEFFFMKSPSCKEHLDWLGTIVYMKKYEIYLFNNVIYWVIFQSWNSIALLTMPSSKDNFTASHPRKTAAML